MHRTDERQIEETVVGHSVRQLLNTTAVVLTDADCDAEQQVVIDLLAVDNHARTRRLVGEERAHQTVQIEPLALATLRLVVVEGFDYKGIETQAGDVRHVARLREFRLGVTHRTDIWNISVLNNI